jgi:multiple sugar transport system substrate-binding protein
MPGTRERRRSGREGNLMMLRSIRLGFLASTMLAGMTAGALAQSLVTADHVGAPDAANTLTMRLNPDQSPNSPHKEMGAKYAAAWQKWAEAHPDWQVQFEFFGQDIGAEHARLLEQARAGRAPDCVTVDSFQLALFVENGVLQPLDEFFTEEEVADLFPFIREGITGADGKIYAWWWGTDLRVLYYNTDIVKTVPQTWDELQATALEASKTGVDGVLFNGGRWEGTTFDWLANFWAQGGELVDAEGKPIFGEGENRDKMLKALTYFKGLVDSGAAPQRVATILNYTDFNAAVQAGTVAMFFGGHWQHFQLAEAITPEALAKWQIAELPGPTPDQRSTGTGGWTVAAFTEDPAKVEACATLMREIYMGPANEAGGDLPTRQSLFETLPRFQDPYYTQLAEYLVHGHARPGVAIYPEISNQIQIMMGEVLSGSKSPEEALDGAWQRTMDAYNKA